MNRKTRSNLVNASAIVRSSQEEAGAERLIKLLRQQEPPIHTIHLWGHYIAELPPVDFPSSDGRTVGGTKQNSLWFGDEVRQVAA